MSIITFGSSEYSPILVFDKTENMIKGYDCPRDVYVEYASKMALNELVSESTGVLFNNIQHVLSVTLEAHLEVCRKELERRALQALKGKPVQL